MAENKTDLTREDIHRLIRKLDAELAERGNRAVIYAVGGANIALAVDGSRTTTDIDVVVKRGFTVVFDAARAVARTEAGLGDDWINAAFTEGKPDGGITWQWFDNADDDQPSTAFAGSALHLELASPEMVLALKTLAQRPQDMDDIYTLMRMTDIKTPEDVGRNLARFTGRRIFDAQGQPGMFIRIDPQFRNIFDNAPDDLRPPGYGAKRPVTDRLRERQERRRAARATRKHARSQAKATRRLADGTEPRCGTVKVTYRGGVEVGRTKPCRRKAGHKGPHKFGGD